MEFSYEELRMIKRALSTEIMRREDKVNTNKEVLEQYEQLYDKTENMIKKNDGTLKTRFYMEEN